MIIFAAATGLRQAEWLVARRLAARFCDRAIDARIRRALQVQARDPAATNDLWAALDRDLTDESPWISLYTPYIASFVSKLVGNYQYHPLWGTLFAQLWVR